MIPFVLAGAALFLLGLAAGWLLAAPRLLRLRERAAAMDSRLEGERQLREKLEQKLEQVFGATAEQVLERVQARFQAGADKDLRQVKTEVDATLKLGGTQIENSFRDMKDRFEQYEKVLRQFEKERTDLYARFETGLKQMADTGQAMRAEAASLKRALTSSSAVRGSWGQRILEDILEKNDFVRGEHFDTQVSVEGESDNALRPDFVFRLPGGKRLVVDSKEVAGEFLLAQETDDAERQREHYGKLVQNIRNNFQRLESKDYQKYVDPDIPYVVMFVSSEPAIRAAFSTEPGLFEEASRRHVILASPMTILPLIYLVRHTWQQYQLAQNARELGEVVEELGNRLFTFVDHLHKVRSGIAGSADAWDKAVGSWEKMVSPQIERAKSLGGRLKESKELAPIEANLRPLTKAEAAVLEKRLPRF